MTQTNEPTRARHEESNQPRRRRAEDDDGAQMKMIIPEGAKAPGDDAKFDYRWANDDGARLQQLHKQDWDFVTVDGKAGKAGDETSVRYRIGAKNDGSPNYAYLMRKPKEFVREDNAKKQAKITKEETARLKEVPEDAKEGGYKAKA